MKFVSSICSKRKYPRVLPSNHVVFLVSSHRDKKKKRIFFFLCVYVCILNHMTRISSHDSHMTLFCLSRHYYRYIYICCTLFFRLLSLLQYSNAMEQPESNPTFCTNNCGFYGSSQFEGMCSKCYRDHVSRSYNAERADSFTSMTQHSCE